MLEQAIRDLGWRLGFKRLSGRGTAVRRWHQRRSRSRAHGADDHHRCSNDQRAEQCGTSTGADHSRTPTRTQVRREHAGHFIHDP